MILNRGKRAKMHVLTIQLKGGLGNQLFQFAKGIELAIQHDMKIFFSTAWYEGQNLRAPEIGQFQIPLDKVVKPIVSKASLSFSPGFACNCSSKFAINEKSFHYEKNETPNKCATVEGYWQGVVNFSENSELIRNYLRKCIQEVPITNHIYVHCRLGDYFKSSKVQEIHPIMTTKYYSKALSIMEKFTKEPDVKLVSDDPQIALGQIMPSNYKFIDCSSDFLFDDFSKLVNSKYLIIGNSTFSWWAGYLSDAELVIAPANWFTPEAARKMNTCDLYLEKWIRI